MFSTCAEFNTGRRFSHLSVEGGKFLCVCVFMTRLYKQDL